MKRSQQPNILFVMADQMAAAALALYGNQVTQTPHLDALAENAVLFENCYCNLPMCGPSRASMHTARLPFNIQMYDNASEFHADIPALPHYLRALGYRTELAGKMHFVGPDQLHGYHRRHTTEIYPANFAWTVDWTQGREYRPTNLTMAPVIESGTCIRSLQMDYDDEVEYHAVQALYDLARKPEEQPFLLTVSFTSPHSPFVISEEYWNLYRHEEIELPSVPEIPLEEKDHLSRNLHYCQARHLYTVTDEHRRTARHAYYGMISYIDAKLGKLLDTLEYTGLRDNTVVVFTSDHGEMMGERGMWFKQHFFDWAARVPLLVSMPAEFSARRIRENVSLIDLMPTLLDLANGGEFNDYIGEIDGQSLLKALNGDTSSMCDTVVSEFAADGSTGPSRMVKQGPWKYMYLEGVDTLLYNNETDPLELNNCAAVADYTEIKNCLESIALDNWDPQVLYDKILLNQQQRLKIHAVTKGVPNYVIKVREDDGERYIRNAGAADTKARARLPYVPSAKPDKQA